MKLISSSPFTNNHSLSSHLALFISHLLQKYVNRERGITKLPYQISDNAQAYTHKHSLLLTLNTNIWKLVERMLNRDAYARVNNSITQKYLPTEMPKSYLLFLSLNI